MLWGKRLVKSTRKFMLNSKGIRGGGGGDRDPGPACGLRGPRGTLLYLPSNTVARLVQCSSSAPDSDEGTTTRPSLIRTQ